MQATTNGTLAQTEVKFSDKSACCVIMASMGYPQKYKSGFELVIEDEARSCAYVAGAKLNEGKLVTGGGRVIGLTAVADSLDKAIDGAYELVGKVHFENAFYRRDIGKRAMLAFEEVK